MKNTSRLILVLSISVLCTIAFASAQKSSTGNRLELINGTGVSSIDSLRDYKALPSCASLERNNASTTDTIDLRRVHLALCLVSYPELNRAQQKIILDAISPAGRESFTGILDNPAENTEGDNGLKLLKEVFRGSGRAEEEILQKYSILSGLAMNGRRAAFRKSSIKDKSELWRTHLALSLVNRPELSELQKETVLDAMALATPDWFKARTDKDNEKSNKDVLLRSLEERIVAAFSNEERVRIFSTLGGEAAQCVSSLDQRTAFLPSTMTSNEVGNFTPLNRWTSNELTWQDLELERNSCQCSTESDWCPIGGRCIGSNCSQTTSGCGILWSYPCNGASCQDGKPTPTPSPKPSPKSSPNKEAI